MHVLTASGAVLGFLALLAAGERDFARMFLWLGAAAVVDGFDGAIARRVGVARALPRYSGEVLDLVVDYLTYVVVPAYALWAAGALPPGLDLIGAAAICLTSALYFADQRMKTEDWYFRGFPAVWNVVAFYLLLLRPDPILGAIAVFALAALSFAPVVFIHPLRVRRWRTLTLLLLALWIALALVAVLANLDPPAIVRWGLLAIGLYFLLAGLSRGASRRRSPEQ